MKTVTRIPWRMARNGQLQRCVRRPFSSGKSLLEAQNFTMPAMSPTMTEGNIASWKVKEGDSFATGDVLLEIETDKASMDVEAADDGVMFKILAQDGSKSVQVGTRIAVLAATDDDLSSLEMPADDSKPVSKPSENVKEAEEEQKTSEPAPTGSPQAPRPSRDRPKTSPTGPGQNTKYPLYPSVTALIHENEIPDDEVSKITATGPNNRLLKGDVLAYLGQIQADYSTKASQRIEHLSHLDLSNIKIIPAAEVKAKAASPSDSPLPDLPPETTVSLPISLSEVLKVQKKLQDTLSTTIPLATFLARAVELANDDLPRSKSHQPSQDELFDAILGLDTIPTTSRGTFLPAIDAIPPASLSTGTARSTTTRLRPSQQPDIIDILTGRAGSSRSSRGIPVTPRTISAGTAPGHALNLFTVTAPASEALRARTFLERMKTVLQVEPGRLVL